MRVRFIKKHKDYASGDVIEVTPNVAFGLIDSGYAILSKDMTEDDYKPKKTKVVK